MRCFIALPLPEGARARLAEAAAALRGADEGGRLHGGDGLGRSERPGRGAGPRISWTREGGYHITLAFLGEIEAGAAEAAAAALEAAAGFGGIAFRFDGFGGFPNLASWRVLFAKIEDSGRSAELFGRVDRALLAGGGRAGSGPQGSGRAGGKPFLPHVTLARASSGRAGPGSAAALLEGAWTIGRCALYKSELQRSGAVYTELRGVDL